MAKKKAKKKAAKKKAAKKKSAVKAMTQAQVVSEVAEKTELAPKQIKAVFAALSEVIARECNPKSTKAPGVVTIPGICKVRTVKRPAKKARKGVNPFTGEEMMFKAKPASTAVRLRPIKNLKDLFA